MVMSEARRLLRLFEGDPSDYDKGLLKALGISAPDDWADEQPVTVDTPQDIKNRETLKSRTRVSDRRVPDWETDDRSIYHVVGDDFRNLNFCKKYIYDESVKAEGGDPSRLVRMTVWAFDGRYGRGVFTVFGSPKIFPKIAEAMRVWNSEGANSYPTKAVLVSSGNYLRLIWAAGKDVDVPLEHNSFNQNPFNDREFTAMLQALVLDVENDGQEPVDNE